MYPVSRRFLQTVAGTHQAVVRALLCTERQFGPSPVGAELPILAGDVKYSSTADIKSTLDITVPGDFWDAVQPYGPEVWVARGVAFGDGTSELVPLGYFHIHDAQQDEAPFGPVQLACQDRVSLIMQNRVLFPYQVPDGTTHRTIFERLVNGRVTPDADLNTAGYAAFLFTAIPIIWTGYDPDRVVVTGAQVVEDSTYDFLNKLADSKNCVLRFDELGQLHVELRDPDPDAAPVYAIGPGANGNLVSASRKTTADGVYNIVSAYGSDPAAPTGYQLSYNKDRTSPLRWDGTFGPAPRYYASPLLRTPDAAADAAAAILSHYTGLPTTLGLWTVPNPALRPQDSVSAKITGLAEVHAVDEVTIPVTISGAGPVEITTKTTNVVVIPDVPDVPDDGSGSGQAQPTAAQIAQEKAFELTSTAENSTVQWWTQFSYLEDIGDGRGYTGGIFGATSATGDMLELVQQYVSTKPTNNVLAPFLPGLQTCATTGMGSSATSTANSQLGAPFKTAWATAATDPVFQTAQINYRNQVYWTPAFNAATADGLSNLGLAIYYDTCINHGAGSPAEDDGSFDDIRAATTATPPSASGDEATFLKAFLVKRGVVLTAWGDNPVDGRIAMFNALIDTANFTLTCPFSWSVYGDSYTMSTDPLPYGFVSGGSGGGSVAFPTPAIAHNIGSVAGQNSFNLGVGFDSDPTYGTTHHDFTRDEIEAGLTIPGYYELNAAGEVLMSAHPGGGKTSNNTSYSRVEYRELERDGKTKMAFNPSVGRHYIKGRSEVDALATAKPQVVIAQMHNADDDTAMVYINNATQVLAKVNGTSIGTLGSHTVGGPVHDWMIEIVDGTINFYWDDLTTVKLSSTAFQGVTAGQYFKAGDYMQWNLTNGDATISRVRLVGLEHWHSQTPLSATPWPQPARPAGQTGSTGGGSTGTGTAGFLAQLFVSPTGSDSNDGLSKAAPKLTIGAAITAASAGNTISVATGTYSGNLVPSKGGSAGSYITVRSETPRGARISGNGSGNQAAVEINHPYLRFQDMDITGDPSSVRYGVMITADNVDIRNCHIHDICQFRTEGTSFQGGAGIDFEGDTHANITLDGNEIHAIGPGVGAEQLTHGMYLSGDCTNVVVSNNLIYNCEDFGIQVYPTTGSSGFVHVNNTVVGNGRGIQQADDGVTRNNISYNNLGSNYDIRGTGNVLSNNISGGTGNTTGSGITAGVNPLFARYATDGTGDFHLQSTSPALNAGTMLDAPSRDFAGTTRPQGTGIDVGAFETVVGTTTTGGSTGGGSTGTGSTGGTSTTDDGVEAAKLLGWGAVIDGDEFNYIGAPDPAKWGLYDGPGHDGNGRRVPSAFTVANGVMTCTGLANGDTGGMAHSRENKFCRIEARVRTYSINPNGPGHRYHPVLIEWPTSDEWPQGGEFDFYECDCDSGKYEAYLHIPGNDGSAQEYVEQACDISQWHNIAFEWRKDGITGWLDGQQVFNFPGFKQPPGTMHFTYQLDNFFGASGMEPAKFDCMFVRIYNPPT